MGPSCNWVGYHPLPSRAGLKDMDHTAAAIREAADRGGYGYRWWKANDIEDGVGYNALPMRALTEHLHDPAF